MDPLHIAIEWAASLLGHAAAWVAGWTWPLMRAAGSDPRTMLVGVTLVIAGTASLLAMRLVQALAVITISIGLALIGVGAWGLVL